MNNTQNDYKSLLKKVAAKDVNVRTSFNITMAELIDHSSATDHSIMLFSNVFIGTLLKNYVEQHFKQARLEFSNMGQMQSVGVITNYNNNNHKEALSFTLSALSMANDLYMQWNLRDVEGSLKDMEQILNKGRLNQRLTHKIEEDFFISETIPRRAKV